MSLKDPNWKYDSAEVSRKPGYLKAKFAKVRKQQADEAKRLEAEKLERIARTVTPFRGNK